MGKPLLWFVLGFGKLETKPETNNGSNQGPRHTPHFLLLLKLARAIEEQPEPNGRSDERLHNDTASTKGATHI